MIAVMIDVTINAFDNIFQKNQLIFTFKTNERSWAKNLLTLYVSIILQNDLA